MTTLEEDCPNLTRRERKRLRRLGVHNEATSTRNGGLHLKTIYPKTDNQQHVFDLFHDEYNLLLHGYAGCGKTFLALYLAIKEVLEGNQYEKVVIVRSALPSRNIGFLPGSKADKMKEYEAPYYGIFSELFGRGDAYQILKTKNLVEFMPTSFIRGITINNAIVIVDECQNLDFVENSTMVTRLGDNSRVIFCGDFRQSDHKFKDEKQGVMDFLKVVREMRTFGNVEMGIEDIVRGETVKDFIITASRHGLM